MATRAWASLQGLLSRGKRAKLYGEDTAPTEATIAAEHAALGGDIPPLGLSRGGVGAGERASLPALRARARRAKLLHPPSDTVIAASQAPELPELPKSGTTTANTFSAAARAAAEEARRRRTERRDDDDGDDPCPMDDDAQHAAPARGQSAQEKRNARHNAGFEDWRQQHKADYVLHQESVYELRKAELLVLQAFYTARVEVAVQSHACKTWLRDADVAVKVQETSDVQIVTPTGQFPLSWPKCISCSHCDLVERGPLSPLALGLFPANPSYSHIFFDTRVLDLAGELTMGSRVSYEGGSCARTHFVTSCAVLRIVLTATFTHSIHC